MARTKKFAVGGMSGASNSQNPTGSPVLGMSQETYNSAQNQLSKLPQSQSSFQPSSQSSYTPNYNAQNYGYSYMPMNSMTRTDTTIGGPGGVPQQATGIPGTSGAPPRPISIVPGMSSQDIAAATARNQTWDNYQRAAYNQIGRPIPPNPLANLKVGQQLSPEQQQYIYQHQQRPINPQQIDPMRPPSGVPTLFNSASTPANLAAARAMQQRMAQDPVLAASNRREALGIVARMQSDPSFAQMIMSDPGRVPMINAALGNLALPMQAPRATPANPQLYMKKGGHVKHAAKKAHTEHAPSRHASEKAHGGWCRVKTADTRNKKGGNW